MFGTFDWPCANSDLVCAILGVLLLFISWWYDRYRLHTTRLNTSWRTLLQPLEEHNQADDAVKSSNGSNKSDSNIERSSSTQSHIQSARTIANDKKPVISNVLPQTRYTLTNFVPADDGPPTIEVPKSRARAFPEHIPCKLAVTLEAVDGTPSRYVHAEVFQTKWLDGNAFEHCVQLVEEFVEQKAREHHGVETPVEGESHTGWYRKSLQYSILEQFHKSPPASWKETMSRTNWDRYPAENSTERSVYSESIKQSGEWWEKLPRSLAEYLLAERDATLLVEIELFCTIAETSLTDPRRSGTYAKYVSGLLFAKRVWLDTDAKDQWFIPKGFLDHFFKVEVVRRLVEDDQELNHDEEWHQALQESHGTKDAFIRHIHNFGVRLLASSIWAELDLRCLYYLWRDTRTKDTDIPLSKALPAGKSYGKIDLKRFENFVTWQGSLRACDFLQRHQKHEIVKKGVVIPVIKADPIGNGLNGQVFRVRVHEDHHAFHPNRNELFALKTIVRTRAVPDKEHEIKILSTLAKVPHPHLTRLLASWSQGDRCFILMPLARQNLYDFISKSPPPTFDVSFITWLFAQFTGLAAGVSHIHHLDPAEVGPIIGRTSTQSSEKTGYHHDLKPKNILLFGDGVLRISDFGTARLQQVITAGVSHKTGNWNADPEYAAPEYSLTGEASRPHDIWSLGCIFLEMLVWAFGNYGEVDKFILERNPNEQSSDPRLKQQWSGTASFWYRTTSQGAELKDAVKSRITCLKENPNSKLVFADLIQLIESMLTISSTRRPRITTVLSTLEGLNRQAALNLVEHGEGYFMESARSPSNRTYAPPSIAESDLEDDRSESGPKRHVRSMSLQPPQSSLRRHSMGQVNLGPPPITEAFPQLISTDVASDLLHSGQQFHGDYHSAIASDGSSTRPQTPATPNTPLITTEDYDQSRLQNALSASGKPDLYLGVQGLPNPE